MIKINGSAKVVKIYNVTRLEMEGVDIDAFDLGSKEDVRELFEIVNDFVESGEADIIEPPIEIEGADPENVTITIEQKRYYPDELTLKNVSIEDLLQQVQESNVGDLYYIKSFEGEGEWTIESEGESSNVQIGYVDCSLYFDQYDVLKEGYLDSLCDTILPRKVEVEGENTEVAEFIFNPVQVWGQLYKVVEDVESGTKLLQRIDFGGRMLESADFIVDDFEEN